MPLYVRLGMAKAKSFSTLLIAGGIMSAIAFGAKRVFDQKEAFKYLRIGLADANNFRFKAETNSLEFDLVLWLQNLAGFSLNVIDFTGKAFVNGKEFGYLQSVKGISIKPKSEAKQTIYLSIPATNLIQEVGFSIFSMLKRSNTKRKVMATPIRFEGIATLPGGVQVPISQIINI